MTQYVINIGALPNDGTGDPLRTAFNETNLNFDQVFAAGPVLSNVQIANNSILTLNTNGNLVLAPNGTGVVQSNVHVVPNTANIRNLGASDRRWATVYTQYLDVSANLNISGNIIYNGDLVVDGNLTVQGNIIQIGNIVTDSKTIQLANTAGTANAANGSGITVGANDNIATVLYNSTSNTWTTNIGISSVGNITAPYFIGNGSQLTGLAATYGNANVATFLANFGSNTISSTGNISGGYILGNGSQLTGLAATYGNANVATFLANFGSNTISSTGNVTAGNVIVGNVVGSGNAISMSVAGNTWIFNGVTSNLTIPPNGAIRTSGGTNGNIVVHPDGTGQVVIQGSTTNDALLLLQSDTADTQNRIEIDTFGTSNNLGGVFSGRFSRGNIGAYTAVQAGDQLVSLRGKGYDGSNFSNPVGTIGVYAFDNWTPGNVPSQLRFYTTGYNDGSNRILNMTISPTGNVDILNGNLIVSGGSGYLQGNTVTGNDALYAGSANFVPLGSNVVAQFGANSNSYSQINFQNINNGTLASTDYVLTANNGTDTTYFVDLGITGNNHSDSAFFGDTTTANDAYLYVVGADAAGPGGGADGNLILGSTNGTIKMFVGNTAQANVIQTITTSGVIVAGDIIPAANTVYSLGNSTNYWSNLWVANNTIYIGGVALGMTAGNVLTVNGNAVLQNNSNTTISTTGNITSGNLISPTLNNSGNISVVASGNTWTFGTDGATIFPTLTITRGDQTGTLTGQALLFGDSTQEALISTPDGVANVTPNSQRLVINPGQGAPGTTGEGGDIYLYAGRGGDAGGSGGDIKIRGGLGPVDGAGGYITMEGGEADVDGIGGYIEIIGGVSGNAAGGTLYMYGGQGRTGGDANVSGGFGTAGPGGDVSIIGGGSANGQAEYGNIFVATGSKNWEFDNTGNLALPRGGIVYETNIPDGGLDGNTIALKPSGGTNADQQLLVYPTTTDANHLHLTSGNLYNTELFLGNDNLYVKLANTGNIVINSNDDDGNTAQWTFSNTGSTQFPNSTITDPGTVNQINLNDSSGIKISTFDTNDIVIETDVDGGDGGTWTFYNDGSFGPGLEGQANSAIYLTGRGATGSSYLRWNNNQANVALPSDTYITAGNGVANISILNSGVGGFTQSWVFDATGSLTLPGGSRLRPLGANLDIFAGTGSYVNLITSDESSYMGVGGAGGYVVTAGGTWDFNTNGNLTAPGNISAVGNVTSGNLTVGSGTITGGNVNGAVFNGNVAFGTGTVGGSGNITGGNLITTGSGGDITMTGGNITGAGNISAGNLIATGNMVLTGSLIGSGASPAPSLSGFSSVSAVTLSATGNVQAGNIRTAGQVSATGNIVTAGNFVGNGAALTNVTVSVAGNIVGTQSNVTVVAGAYNWTFDNTGNLTLPGNTFAVNYANNTPVNAVTRFESFWTVPTGNSTQSFTVTPNETYYMWVDCNIPNGILTWNATATITNTNVPVVGAQYAWVYNGGGTPIDFTSIPNQFVGTANTIVRSSVAPSATTNRFDFGINNASGNAVTVRYGWIAIS